MMALPVIEIGAMDFSRARREREDDFYFLKIRSVRV
jgi:hypothetical protein